MTKRYLFVLRNPNYTGIYIQETVDVILTAAAFDQTVCVLLLDDAVFYLKHGQQSNQTYKNTETLFNLLETMDIPSVFIENESLVEHGLQIDMLSRPITLLSRNSIGHFISQFDIVLTD
jgi:tRNA 2-thiouridine synthesizing protein C